MDLSQCSSAFYSLLEKMEVLEWNIEKERKEFIFMSSRELIDHNEGVIAFENICQNIYEYDVRISKELYKEIEELGLRYNLEKGTWEFLNELIT
jgi:hypothetical protein